MCRVGIGDGTGCARADVPFLASARALRAGVVARALLTVALPRRFADPFGTFLRRDLWTERDR